jgi:hypothetical protein
MDAVRELPKTLTCPVAAEKADKFRELLSQLNTLVNMLSKMPRHALIHNIVVGEMLSCVCGMVRQLNAIVSKSVWPNDRQLGQLENTFADQLTHFAFVCLTFRRSVNT